MENKDKYETYESWVWCTNCKGPVRMKIPKGVTVGAYLVEKRSCPDCGCQTVKIVD